MPDHCPLRGACPVAIVLPGGAQNENLMRESLRPWAQSFRNAGWVVLSPIARSRNRRFFEDGEEDLSGFLEYASRFYLSPGQKFALIGVSNGGISAFRAAVLHPDYFHSVVVAPGYAFASDLERLRRLSGKRITLFVGEYDRWLSAVRRTAYALRTHGVAAVLNHVPQAGHSLASLPWPYIRAAITETRTEPGETESALPTQTRGINDENPT